MIPRDKRFEDSKARANCDPRADYSPNFDFVLKKPAAAVIKKEEVKEELKSKRLERRLRLFADLTISCKAEFSVLTADTVTAPGPGAYEVRYKTVEVSRTVGLPKAIRFEKPAPDRKTPLEVNYRWVEAKAPGVSIQKQVGPNQKLDKIKKEEEVREFQRAQRIIEEAKRKREEELKLITERKRKAAEELEKRQPTEKERLFELFRIVENS